MSRRGNCLDNAPMESFFASLKTERVHESRFRTGAEARAAVFEYIEVFYNCSSERTSRYVLEENRPCCAGSGTAGCVGRRFALRACLSVRFQGLTPLPQYRPSASSRLWPARPAALCLPDHCGLGSDSHGGEVFSGKLLEFLAQTGS